MLLLFSGAVGVSTPSSADAAAAADAGTVAVVAPGSGLVGYWKLDEPSGDSADSVGAHTWTDHGGVGTAAGVRNSARSFDGTTYMSLAGNFGEGATTGSPFSVSCWLYPTTATGDHVALGRFDGTHLFQVWWGQGRNIIASWGVSPYDNVTDWLDRAPDTWYHAVFTFSASGVAKLYIDGEFGATDLVPLGDFTSSAPLNLGRRGGDGASPWLGRIDEVGWYDRELNAAEAAFLYGGGTPPALETYPGLATPVASTDAGSAAEGTPTLLAGTTQAEAGSGADAATLAATTTGADAGAAADTGSAFSGLTVSGSDSGTGTGGTQAILASTTSPDAGAGADAASFATTLAAVDSGSGADASALLLPAASADSAVGTDAGTVQDVTGAVTIQVTAADSGSGLEATVALAAATGDDEFADGADNGWALAGTVDAPFRDRQLLRLLADALRATGEFDEVTTSGLPEARGGTAADLRLASLELDGWQDADHWGDFDSTEQVRTVSYHLHLLVRAEDPDLRDDEVDRLASVASNALNGIPLGDVSVPNRTRLLRGKWHAAAGPERRMDVAGQFTYTIPDFDRHTAAEDA